MKYKLLTVLQCLCIICALLITGGFSALAQDTADTDTLKAILTATESLEASDYSADSYAPLDELYQRYRPIADDMTSQEEVDLAATALLEAINTLRAYVNLSVTTNTPALQPTVTLDGEATVLSGKPVLSGTTVTVTAPEAEGYFFAGWIESVSKRLLSEASEYTFLLSVNTSLQALYLREDCAMLAFCTDGGCIIDVIQKTPQEWATYNSLDELLPRVPYRYGYTNGRWDIPSDTLAQLRNGEMISVFPIYDEADASLPFESTPYGNEIRLELHYHFDSAENVGSFIMNSAIPYSIEPASVGMLFYYQKSSQFDPQEFLVTVNNKMLTSQYDLLHENIYITNMRKMTSKYNWAVRGYVTYPENGELKTVYSNQVNIVNTEDIHEFRTVPATAPTCTESGNTESTVCFICGRIQQEAQEIAALGHEYQNVTEEATCTTNGRIISTCTRCGDTVITSPEWDSDTQTYTHPELLAYGHDYQLTAITTPATLDSIGEAQMHCTRCQDSITQPYYIATGNCGDNVQYSFNHRTGELTLSGSGAMTAYETAAESPFANRNNIKSVTVQSGVTLIGSCAFYRCSGIQSVTLADSVNTIGNRAFYDCQSLADINLGNGLTSIDYYAFYRNTAITRLVLPPSLTTVGDYAFSNCTGLADLTVSDGVQSIGKGAFTVCTSLTQITLPSSVTTVGMSAFEDCTSLASAVMSGGMTRIETSVFSGCTALQHVLLPDSILSILSQAFFNCGTLSDITLPAQLNTIGSSAFSGCTSLEELTLPATMRTIENDAFKNCTSLITQLPNGITAVGSNAFRGCTALTSADIPNSMSAVSSGTYYGCTGLTSLTIPEGITAIEANAFNGCYGLTEIHLPSSVAQIGSNAFAGCNAITAISVDADNTVYDSRDNCQAIIVTASNQLLLGCSNTVIPNSVTAIGNDAFEGCTQLSALTLPESVTEIGDYAFSDCTSLADLIIPQAVNKIGKYAFKNCLSFTHIALPENLTTVSEGLFYGCTGLQEVALSDNVTAVGSYTFYGCSSLTEVTLPDSLTSLSASLFNGCTSLQTFTIPASVKTIGTRAFNNCTSLTAITIPSGVSSLESYAFAGCTGIGLIDLPVSVTKIANQAFRGCTGMHDIYIRNISCTIASNANTLPEQAVIHSYLMSKAKTYADTYSRSFEQIKS